MYTLDDYWDAPRGVGPLAPIWKAKPNRLFNKLVELLFRIADGEDIDSLFLSPQKQVKIQLTKSTATEEAASLLKEALYGNPVETNNKEVVKELTRLAIDQEIDLEFLRLGEHPTTFSLDEIQIALRSDINFRPME